MMEDDDNLADLERRMREKFAAMQAKPTADDVQEKAMVAKLLGTKTQAEQFFRHEARPAAPHGKSRLDLRPKTFRNHKPILRFEYWEGSAGITWSWHIERFENGKRVSVHSGGDWKKRDELLIKLQAAGYTCTPITVAGNVPRPITGRMRDQPKKPSAKAGIMAKLASVTSNDVADFNPEDLDY